MTFIISSTTRTSIVSSAMLDCSITSLCHVAKFTGATFFVIQEYLERSRGRRRCIKESATTVAQVTGALLNATRLRYSAYRWQQYDVIMTSWSRIEEVSKRYHQNFLLCNNNEITACIADLFNSFCEEVYAIAFFKIVQQQTILGKVGNSIMCLWADNFCQKQWNNY